MTDEIARHALLISVERLQKQVDDLRCRLEILERPQKHAAERVAKLKAWAETVEHGPLKGDS